MKKTIITFILMIFSTFTFAQINNVGRDIDIISKSNYSITIKHGKIDRAYADSLLNLKRVSIDKEVRRLNKQLKSDPNNNEIKNKLHIAKEIQFERAIRVVNRSSYLDALLYLRQHERTYHNRGSHYWYGYKVM